MHLFTIYVCACVVINTPKYQFACESWKGIILDEAIPSIVIYASCRNFIKIGVGWDGAHFFTSNERVPWSPLRNVAILNMHF
jgi:hypothetical protein